MIQIEKWIRSSRIIDISEGTIVKEKGASFVHIMIILNGSLEYNGRLYKKGDIFGYEFLEKFENHIDIKLETILFSAEKTKISKIKYSKLLKLFKNNLKNTIKSNKDQTKKY